MKDYTEYQLKEIVCAAAKYGFDYALNSQHQGEVPEGNVLQWLNHYLGYTAEDLERMEARKWWDDEITLPEAKEIVKKHKIQLPVRDNDITIMYRLEKLNSDKNP